MFRNHSHVVWSTKKMEQSARLDVLFEFQESRKPLAVSRDAIIKAVERELAACMGNACLLPPGMSLGETASSSKKSFFLLQRWSLKWNAFIDVQSVDNINDGDKTMVVPAFAPSYGVML